MGLSWLGSFLYIFPFVSRPEPELKPEQPDQVSRSDMGAFILIHGPNGDVRYSDIWNGYDVTEYLCVDSVRVVKVFEWQPLQ